MNELNSSIVKYMNKKILFSFIAASFSTTNQEEVLMTQTYNSAWHPHQQQDSACILWVLSFESFPLHQILYKYSEHIFSTEYVFCFFKHFKPLMLHTFHCLSSVFIYRIWMETSIQITLPTFIQLKKMEKRKI